MQGSTGQAGRPTVSVIIPVKDGAEGLRACLVALQEQTLAPLEVLVVDNNSTEDIAAAMPDDDRFHLLRESTPGSYAARNEALRHARGEVLAFTDADCLPLPTWVEQAVAALTQEPVAGLVGGAVEMTFAGGRPRTAAELYEAKHGFPQEAYLRTQSFAVTANMITWRRVVEQVGPFDGRLQSRGDAEFGQRVAATGAMLRYAPEAVVQHPARATRQELMTKVRRVAVGRRESDHLKGARRGHFVRLASDQLKVGARTFVSTVLLGRPPHVGEGKAKYMALFLWARVAQAGLHLRGALYRPLPQGSTEAAAGAGTT